MSEPTEPSEHSEFSEPSEHSWPSDYTDPTELCEHSDPPEPSEFSESSGRSEPTAAKAPRQRLLMPAPALPWRSKTKYIPDLDHQNALFFAQQSFFLGLSTRKPANRELSAITNPINFDYMLENLYIWLPTLLRLGNERPDDPHVITWAVVAEDVGFWGPSAYWEREKEETENMVQFSKRRMAYECQMLRIDMAMRNRREILDPTCEMDRSIQDTIERQAREQQAMEQQAREQQAREQQARVQHAWEQQARMQQPWRQQAWRKQARRQLAREQLAREQLARVKREEEGSVAQGSRGERVVTIVEG